MASPQDRRRAKRVSPGPFKVAMNEQDGVLVDISESGACVRVTFGCVSDAITAFILKWEDDILLRGRVVRSWVHRDEPNAGAAAPARTQHRIGVEFVSLPPHSVGRLQQLILAAG
jgi:hypothetical protein